MPLSVADLLDLPVMRRGRPQVLCGSELASREVRWVHTSEIYEISPLLKGGEALLTTGLGLVGATAESQRSYIDALAGRGIAVLILELGRTFTSPPPALLPAAVAADLPLVVLRGVVPFIEVTEAVHPLLLAGEIEVLRLTDRIQGALTGALLSGAGLGGVLRVIADLAGCPAQLYAADGHLVAGSERAGRTADTPGSSVHAGVDLYGVTWGRLMIRGEPNPLRAVLAERGAAALSIELGRAGSSAGPGRQLARSTLLRDIALRQYSSAEELSARAAEAGFTPRPGQRVLGICLAVDGPGPAAAVFGAVLAGARGVFGPVLVTDLDGGYAVAGIAEHGSADHGGVTAVDVRKVLTALANAIDAELAAGPGGRATAVACGPPVNDIPALASALRAAIQTSRLARRLDTGLRVLTAADLGAHRLLAKMTTDPDLTAFIDEQLGPLLDHDATHGRDLVRTLDTYLACGLSKTAAAAALGVRRQTLYTRLAKIAVLLGGLDLSARERRTAVDLALVGWRLRAAALPSRSP